MTFKEQLVFYMTKLKLSKEEISASFHASITTVNHWLDKFSEPHPKMASLILSVLKEEYENATR